MKGGNLLFYIKHPLVLFKFYTIGIKINKKEILYCQFLLNELQFTQIYIMCVEREEMLQRQKIFSKLFRMLFPNVLASMLQQNTVQFVIFL